MGASTPDFGALYLRHRERMYAVARSVLKGTAHRDHVDDVVMETMVTLMDRPPAEHIENWEAYLVRATRNKAYDLLKTAHARHAGGTLEPQHDPATDQYLADDIAERVDRQHDAAVLWDSLAVLDTRERSILWDYKALQQPRSEVARKYGISSARVSQISTQALTTLLHELAKEGIHP